MVLFSLAVNAGMQVTADHFPPWTRCAERIIRAMVVASLMLVPLSRCTLLAADNDKAPTETAVGVSDSQGRMLGFARLREGTLVPATVGTIVSIGPRRWGFLPTEKPKPVNVAESIENESLKITVTQQDGTTIRRVDSLTLSVNASEDRFGAGAKRGIGQEAANDQKAKQKDASQLVLITENLMLQRIVQAIREDEFDKSWEVTGKVTEYFGENRLTILTAQRAESKDLPSAER